MRTPTFIFILASALSVVADHGINHPYSVRGPYLNKTPSVESSTIAIAPYTVNTSSHTSTSVIDSIRTSSSSHNWNKTSTISLVTAAITVKPVATDLTSVFSTATSHVLNSATTSSKALQSSSTSWNITSRITIIETIDTSTSNVPLLKVLSSAIANNSALTGSSTAVFWNGTSIESSSKGSATNSPTTSDMLLTSVMKVASIVESVSSTKARISAVPFTLSIDNISVTSQTQGPNVSPTAVSIRRSWNSTSTMASTLVPTRYAAAVSTKTMTANESVVPVEKNATFPVSSPSRASTIQSRDSTSGAVVSQKPVVHSTTIVPVSTRSTSSTSLIVSTQPPPIALSTTPGQNTIFDTSIQTPVSRNVSSSRASFVVPTQNVISATLRLPMTSITPFYNRTTAVPIRQSLISASSTVLSNATPSSSKISAIQSLISAYLTFTSVKPTAQSSLSTTSITVSSSMAQRTSMPSSSTFYTEAPLVLLNTNAYYSKSTGSSTPVSNSTLRTGTHVASTTVMPAMTTSTFNGPSSYSTTNGAIVDQPLAVLTLSDNLGASSSINPSTTIVSKSSLFFTTTNDTATQGSSGFYQSLRASSSAFVPSTTEIYVSLSASTLSTAVQDSLEASASANSFLSTSVLPLMSVTSNVSVISVIITSKVQPVSMTSRYENKTTVLAISEPTLATDSSAATFAINLQSAVGNDSIIRATSWISSVSATFTPSSGPQFSSPASVAKTLYVTEEVTQTNIRTATASVAMRSTPITLGAPPTIYVTEEVAIYNTRTIVATPGIGSTNISILAPAPTLFTPSTFARVVSGSASLSIELISSQMELSRSANLVMPSAITKVLNGTTVVAEFQTRTMSNVASQTAGIFKKYYQCGGRNFKDKGVCEEGSTCKYQNDWYWQCVGV